MKKLLLVAFGSSVLFFSCSSDDGGSSDSSLNVPEASIGFTKNGKNFVILNCSYTRSSNGECGIDTDDPKISGFDWDIRSDQPDTYQFITGSLSVNRTRMGYTRIEGEDYNVGEYWKMTSGTMIIAERTSNPITISGTFEGVMTKFDSNNNALETSEVRGKFVKIPRSN